MKPICKAPLHRRFGSSTPDIAFTLLELLLVISIIGLLAALLLPALSRAKQKAQGIYCMNNVRQLVSASHLYAGDHNDWLPPNPEDQHSPLSWVSGNMNNPEEATNTLYLTDPQWAKLAPYHGTSPSIYRCPADKSTTLVAGITYPRVRSVAMNQAIGTKLLPPLAAVDGPWLDGTHHHTANTPWRTYGRLADMVSPSPSRLWMILDEDGHSINDAAFAVIMTPPARLIDWPGTYHNMSDGIAFADGHSEIHRWVDPRTKWNQAFAGGDGQSVPSQINNVDISWLQERTSARHESSPPPQMH